MNVQKSTRKRISTSSYVPDTTHMSYNFLVSNETIYNIIDDGINGISQTQTRPSVDTPFIEQNFVIDPEESQLQARATSLFQILLNCLDTIHDDSNDEMLIESFSSSTEEEQSNSQKETIYGDHELDSLMKKIDHECYKLASRKQRTTESDGEEQQEYILCLEKIFA